MTKEEFLELNIEKKIDYINKKLSEGQTVIRIREDMGIGEKSLQKIIKENGYRYCQKEKIYYKESTNVLQKNIINIKENLNEDYKDTTNVLQNYKDDLLAIVQAKEEIFEVINAFKENLYYKDITNVIEVVASNEIQIKDFDSEAKGTSFRVYDETLTKWKEFCNKHKKYNNQDLASMALEEYIEKYKL
jgi:actin-like ATPase involved in cell morphogenesis